MAGWRQAVALAMTGEEIETDGSVAVADRTGRPGLADKKLGSDAARLSGEAIVLCRGTKTWRASSNGCSAASSDGLQFRRACGT